MACTRTTTLTLVGSLALSLAACGGKDPTLESGEVGTDEGEGEGGSSATEPALGFSIVEVEANHGTRVPIGLDGEWVDGAGRNAALARGRDTLIRVHHVVSEGWVPRVLEAHLEVHLPDGTVHEYVQALNIEGSSDVRTLDSGFYFGLTTEAGETEPGTSYQVSIWETSDAGAGLPAAVNVTPTSGPGLIGFEDTEMVIKVMFVPILYQNSQPDLNAPENLAGLVDWLYQTNPVTRVEAEVREAVPYSSTLTNLGALLGVMEQTRNIDNAPSNVYYAAITDAPPQPLGGTGGVVLGIANLGGLVSANHWLNSLQTTTETVTHEIGHNQGLNHIYCPDDSLGAAGTDPSYPYADGKIGNRGFGIRNFQLYREDLAVDYMTYCGPQWVSDWTWNKVWGRIATFSAQGDVVPQVPVLRTALYPDGTTESWTTITPFDPARAVSTTHQYEFERGGEVVVVPTEVETLSDDATLWISAPVPHGDADVSDYRVRRVVHDVRVDVDSIRLAGR